MHSLPASLQLCPFWLQLNCLIIKRKEKTNRNFTTTTTTKTITAWCYLLLFAKNNICLSQSPSLSICKTGFAFDTFWQITIKFNQSLSWSPTHKTHTPIHHSLRLMCAFCQQLLHLKRHSSAPRLFLKFQKGNGRQQQSDKQPQ